MKTNTRNSACAINLTRLQYSTALIPSTVKGIEANKSLISALLLELELCAMMMTACVPSIKRAIQRFITNRRPSTENSTGISTAMSQHQTGQFVDLDSQEIEKIRMDIISPIERASPYNIHKNTFLVHCEHKPTDIEAEFETNGVHIKGLQC